MTRWDHQPETDLIYITSNGFGETRVEGFIILNNWLSLASWMRSVEQRHEKELITAAMKKYRRWASEGAG